MSGKSLSEETLEERISRLELQGMLHTMPGIERVDKLCKDRTGILERRLGELTNRLNVWHALTIGLVVDWVFRTFLL